VKAAILRITFAISTALQQHQSGHMPRLLQLQSFGSICAEKPCIKTVHKNLCGKTRVNEIPIKTLEFSPEFS
jgi:hypothetical protein